MKKERTTIVSLFSRRRGMAVFIASLVLLAVAVLAMSTMTRISATSNLAGHTLAKKKLDLLADTALRVALGELTGQFIAASGSPDTMMVNGDVNNNNPALFRIVADRRDGGNKPLFAYRAIARLLLIGDGNVTLPGMEFPVSNRNSCYDVELDTVEIVNIPGTSVQTNIAQPTTGTLPTGYYYGQKKGLGVTTCFRKRNN
ncbi:MAG TPA: hypothetical protein P5077_05385 [bacterium]|nr:hypothetical protein [bacterium]